MRSLQSMLIAASTLGHTFHVVSEGERLYTGKNPRDAYQIIRDMEEVTLRLVSNEGIRLESAFLTPGETDCYICDCSCDGFFDKWSD
jgi:hypothetical protein